MDDRIRTAIMLIEQRPGARHDAITLARVVNLGASRFRHLFLQHTGASLRTFVADCRLRRAATMLRGTPLRVSEIAYSLSYSDLSHFNRAFRMKYGLSPRAFRRLNSSVLDHRSTMEAN